MDRKFVRTKRVVIPMLTALVLVAQMGAASAAEIGATDLVELTKDGQVVEVVTKEFRADAISMASPATPGKVVASATTSPTPIKASEAQANGEKLDLSSVQTSQFGDWDPNAWWATSGGMKYAIGMGYIKGQGSGSGLLVAPTAPVTQAEFITVLARMCLPADTIQSYAEQTKAEYFSDIRAEAAYDGLPTPTDQELEDRYAADPQITWYDRQGIRKAIQEIGLTNWAGISSTPTTEVCTRAQMATLLYNAMIIRSDPASKDLTASQKVKAMEKMTDHVLFDRRGAAYVSYGDAIAQVIQAGLIKGDEAGKFNPGSTMGRAEMAEVVYRLDNPKLSDESTPRDKIKGELGIKDTTPGTLPGTTNPDTTPTDPGTTPTDPGTTPGTTNPGTTPGTTNPGMQVDGPITIDNRDPEAPHRAPREGDTIIRADGTTVTLERDPVTGVLGFGQNVGAYLGVQSPNTGKIVRAGAWVMSGLGAGIWTDPLALGWYVKCDVPGYENEYHWSGEWSEIMDVTWPTGKGVKGTEGQTDSTGLWKCDSDGDWIWQGPGNV